MMMTSTKISVRVGFVAVVLWAACLMNVERCFAADTEGSDRVTLEIKMVPEAEALEALMDQHKFEEAEKLAREKNLDTRIIATICACAGKKEEAFALFSNFIQKAPEDLKEKLALQSVSMLSNEVVDFSDEFLSYLIDNKIVSISENKLRSIEINRLLRSGKTEEAAKEIDILLDSPNSESDSDFEFELVNHTMVLASQMSMAEYDAERINTMLEKLRRKFPNNLQVRLQWIQLSADAEPQKMLVELDNLKTESPEFYKKSEMIIRLTRAQIFEKMGKTDLAKSEYQSMLGSDFGTVAQMKIDEYDTMDRIEQEFQKNIDLANQTQDNQIQLELSSNPTYVWTAIVYANVAFLVALVLYIVYRLKK